MHHLGARVLVLSLAGEGDGQGFSPGVLAHQVDGRVSAAVLMVLPGYASRVTCAPNLSADRSAGWSAYWSADRCWHCSGW